MTSHAVVDPCAVACPVPPVGNTLREPVSRVRGILSEGLAEPANKILPNFGCKKARLDKAYARQERTAKGKRPKLKCADMKPQIIST